jgi:hypothetical protein
VRRSLARALSHTDPLFVYFTGTSPEDGIYYQYPGRTSVDICQLVFYRVMICCDTLFSDTNGNFVVTEAHIYAALNAAPRSLNDSWEIARRRHNNLSKGVYEGQPAAELEGLKILEMYHILFAFARSHVELHALVSNVTTSKQFYTQRMLIAANQEALPPLYNISSSGLPATTRQWLRRHEHCTEGTCQHPLPSAEDRRLRRFTCRGPAPTSRGQEGPQPPRLIIPGFRPELPAGRDARMKPTQPSPNQRQDDALPEGAAAPAAAPLPEPSAIEVRRRTAGRGRAGRNSQAQMDYRTAPAVGLPSGGRAPYVQQLPHYDTAGRRTDQVPGGHGRFAYVPNQDGPHGGRREGELYRQPCQASIDFKAQPLSDPTPARQLDDVPAPRHADGSLATQLLFVPGMDGAMVVPWDQGTPLLRHQYTDQTGYNYCQPPPDPRVVGGDRSAPFISADHSSDELNRDPTQIRRSDSIESGLGDNSLESERRRLGLD